MKKLRIIIFLLIILAVFVFGYFQLGIRPRVEQNASEIKVPPGFKIEVFAEGLSASPASYPGPNDGPRFLEIKDGVLFTSLMRQGKVVALPDKDGNGKADGAVTVIEGLRNPHGIVFSDGWFYVAEENRISRFKLEGLKADKNTLEVLFDNLPSGGHITRTIRISNDTLYLSIGSSCNVCYDEDGRRAAISACSIENKTCLVIAKGLRNSVGMIFYDGKLWATDNGRDMIGEDVPPEEINIIREGKNYGWPVCYGNRIHDTDFDKNVYIRNPCEDTEPPVFEMQAHSAPLGLTFYNGNNFPEEYQGNLFVAFHGSWNRNIPTGYKIVRIHMEDGVPKNIEDFATGWLKNFTVTGRPVDLIVGDDGSLFVSDDNAGKIYRIYYQK